MRKDIGGLVLAVAAAANAASAQTPPAKPAQAPVAKPAAKSEGSTVQGVTVTGDGPTYRSSIDRRSYSVANDLQATTGSIADALRNIPSVDVDVQGNVSLRGDPGVTILIDGRPAAMFRGQGRADALQQLPADQIDRVEVMTNPSAAFKPDGGAGIINLVTKKGQRGARTASARVNYGDVGRINGGVSAGYNGKRLSLSGDVGGRHERSKGAAVRVQRRLDPASGRWSERRDDTGIAGQNDSTYARLSGDYDLDDRTRLSASANRYDGRYRFVGPSVSTGAAPFGLSRFDQTYQVRGRWTSTQFTGGLRRKFSGDEHEFTLDLSANENRNGYHSDVVNRPPLPTPYEITGLATDAREQELKAEYKRPMPARGRLQLGYELNRQDNDYGNRLWRGAGPDDVQVDAAFSNDFGFRQRVHAAYVTYQQPVGDLTVMPGLRIEAVETRLDHRTLNTVGRRDYLRAYPTLHLAYQLDETRQLSASYSRRVQRPNPEDLNPFRSYYSVQEYRQGNIGLKPQTTDSFELGWQLKKDAAFYQANLYYRRSRAGVTDVVRELPGGVLLITKDNLSRSETAGLELVANGKLTPKVSYNLSADLLRTEIDASAVDLGPLGVAGRRGGVSSFGRGNLNWQPTANDFIQLNAIARGRVLVPQGYREPVAWLNLGYRHKVSERLSLVATAQDLFDAVREVTVTDTPVLKDRTERHVSARAVYLGLRYSLGGSKRRAPEPAFDFGGSAGPG